MDLKKITHPTSSPPLSPTDLERYKDELDAGEIICPSCQTPIPIFHDQERTSLSAWNDHKATCPGERLKRVSSPISSLSKTSDLSLKRKAIDDRDRLPARYRMSFSTSSVRSSSSPERTSTSTSWPSSVQSYSERAAYAGSDGEDELMSEDEAAHPPPPPLQAMIPPAFMYSTVIVKEPAKRRKKRSEDERKAHFANDPFVERFEAYRVLCKLCSKWIRLRPNSTYCSIPWEAHRASCVKRNADGVTCASPALRSHRMTTSTSPIEYRYPSMEVPRPSAYTASSLASLSAVDICRSPSNARFQRGPSLSPTATHQQTSDAPSGYASRSTPLGARRKVGNERTRSFDAYPAERHLGPLITSIEDERAHCTICKVGASHERGACTDATAWQRHRARCASQVNERSPSAYSEAGWHGYTVADIKPRGAVAPSPPFAVRPQPHEAYSPRYPTCVCRHHSPDLASVEGRRIFAERSVDYLHRTTYAACRDRLDARRLVAFLSASMPPMDASTAKNFDIAEVEYIFDC